MLGRTHRPEFRSLIDAYVERIGQHAAIELMELRETSSAAFRKVKFAAGATIVLLDASGRQFNSAQFAKWLGGLRDRGVRELVFLCGSAEGFPEELRKGASHSISLSTMTMSHELARVVLAEQIYRAYTILAGHPYAK